MNTEDCFSPMMKMHFSHGNASPTIAYAAVEGGAAIS